MTAEIVVRCHLEAPCVMKVHDFGEDPKLSQSMMMGPAIADPPECSPPQMPSHAMFVLHVKHNPHI